MAKTLKLNKSMEKYHGIIIDINQQDKLIFDRVKLKKKLINHQKLYLKNYD